MVMLAQSPENIQRYVERNLDFFVHIFLVF